jgi:DNA-binding SARP family transcriptional activator
LVEFRVLGPVEMWSAGRRFQLHTTKQRALLAALVADAGTAIGVDTLIDRVWDAAPPQQARNALYAQINRLRQVLSQVVDATGGPVTLARRSGGYALEVDPETVDMHRMRRLVDRARTGGCTEGQRAALLREAIQL